MIADRTVEALNRLELRELSLINRGAHSAAQTQAEVVGAITDAGGDQSTFDSLLAAGLLLKTPNGLFRTRMAETVHQLATLRQWMRWRTSEASPELIAEYRLLHRPRRRPSRDVDGENLVRALGAAGRLGTSVGRAVVPGEVAGFQVRATEAILTAYRSRRSSGVVVSAGTGSGKSLSFYAPALAAVASEIADEPSHRLRVLSLYPRSELLKDQLQSVVAQVLKIGTVGTRPMRVAAWYSDVPGSASHAALRLVGWREKKKVGYLCPFLRCPDCGSELFWLVSDVDRAVERLSCRDAACGRTMGEEVFPLTRRSIRARPADLLFTTTESLNRQLGDARNTRAFGIRSRAPRFVLLDEAHTYEGISGAQTAFLLRRYRRSLGRQPVTWVGLSATLLHADSFFADLVHLSPLDVAVEGPREAEIENYGAEYLLALRHDGGSGTGPLSATIQVAMSLGRSLDAQPGDVFGPQVVDSEGLYGRKTFIFTDKLDVTNRLYWDLLDAEGWWDEGKRHNQVPSTLAHLRSDRQERLGSGRSAGEARLATGQWWWLAQALGHDIESDQSLRVGRVSSQDRGVSEADLIVATAALEVGYDDPDVGAVVQHRAPHDGATFLQRKGRAGRLSVTRPWTVVVLGGGSRDARAWQAYDQLFDPDLEASRLPLSNRYVRRMQVVYAALDWLASTVGGQMSWADLSTPAATQHNPDWRDAQNERQRRLAEVIRDIMLGGPALGRLVEHLRRSMVMAEDELEPLLWEPPRALIATVLPTALRRLEMQWRGEHGRLGSRSHPLPEFIAGNLFDALLTPEVTINGLSSDSRAVAPQQETLPAARVFREFLPGNVTRHFGIRAVERRHWLPVSSESRHPQPVSAYGAVFLRRVGGANPVDVFAPTSINLSEPPTDVLDSSTMFPSWEASIAPIASGRGVLFAEPSGPVSALSAHLHADGGGVSLCRFVRRAQGQLRRRDGAQWRSVNFVDAEGDPAALGIDVEADGLAVDLRIPPPDAAITALERTQRLVDLIDADATLASLHRFEREALSQAILLVLARSGREAFAMADHTLQVALDSAIDDLGTRWTAFDVPDPDAPLDWAALLGAVRSCVAESDSTERSAAWVRWHAKRVAYGFGGLLSSTAGDLLPAYDESDVAVEVEDLLEDGSGLAVRLWLVEDTPGGNGSIEALVEVLEGDQLTFRQRLSQRATDPDGGRFDEALTQLIEDEDPKVESLAGRLRVAWDQGHARVTEVVDALTECLRGRGGDRIERHLVGYLATRPGAPGAHADSLALVRMLLRRWEQVRRDVGYEVSAKILATTMADDVSLDHYLAGRPVDTAERANALAGLLWPRGLDLVGNDIVPGPAYGDRLSTSTTLVRPLIAKPWPTVEVSASDWMDNLEGLLKRLSEEGTIGFVLANGKEAVRDFILRMLTATVDDGVLLLHPYIRSCYFEAGTATVVVSLSEVLR